MGKLKKLFSNKKTSNIVIVLGVCGILLILFSDFLFSGKSGKDEKSKSVADPETSQTDAMAYEQALEQRLAEILSGIKGAGKVEVMITIESSAENIYAVEQSGTTQNSRETGENSQKQSEQTEVKQEYVFIETDGNKTALIKTQLQPEVRGVVVSCQGASSNIVREMVVNAVTTALSISINKVCVVTHSN